MFLVIVSALIFIIAVTYSCYKSECLTPVLEEVEYWYKLRVLNLNHMLTIFDASPDLSIILIRVVADHYVLHKYDYDNLSVINRHE